MLGWVLRNIRVVQKIIDAPIIVIRLMVLGET
jgi:hypothetical protein